MHVEAGGASGSTGSGEVHRDAGESAAERLVNGVRRGVPAVPGGGHGFAARQSRSRLRGERRALPDPAPTPPFESCQSAVAMAVRAVSSSFASNGSAFS